MRCSPGGRSNLRGNRQKMLSDFSKKDKITVHLTKSQTSKGIGGMFEINMSD